MKVVQVAGLVVSSVLVACLRFYAEHGWQQPWNRIATVPKFSYVKQGSTVSGAVNEVTSSAKPTTGDQFSYDPKSKQYYFNWGTKGLTSGTYVLQIKLGDAVSRTVKVGLK